MIGDKLLVFTDEVAKQAKQVMAKECYKQLMALVIVYGTETFSRACEMLEDYYLNLAEQGNIPDWSDRA